MKKVEEYLKKVKIKKVVVGGLDEKAVYQVMDTVCNLYNEELKANEEYMQLQSGVVQQVETKGAEHKEQIRKLSEELRKANASLDALKNENSQLKSMLVDYIALKEMIRMKAEKEAGQVRKEAELEAVRINKEAKKEYARLQKEICSLKSARKTMLQGFHEVQKFCTYVGAEIGKFQVPEKSDETSSEALQKAEDFKTATVVYGETFQKKLREQIKGV